MDEPTEFVLHIAPQRACLAVGADQNVIRQYRDRCIKSVVTASYIEFIAKLENI